MKFGNILKLLMLEGEITQQKLANEIGYAQRTVSSWINNQSEPTETAIIKCAEFFEVSTDYLLGLDKFNTPTVDISPNPALYSHEELELIKKYRELNAPGKKLINTTINTLLTSSAGSVQNKNKTS